MPTKKKPKHKTREYLEYLLEKYGVSDKEIARSIAVGLKSENSIERTKALEMAAKWKGFNLVDMETVHTVPLMIGNMTQEDIERMVGRCRWCKHEFTPKNGVMPAVSPGKGIDDGAVVSQPVAPGTDVEKTIACASETSAGVSNVVSDGSDTVPKIDIATLSVDLKSQPTQEEKAGENEIQQEASGGERGVEDERKDADAAA